LTKWIEKMNKYLEKMEDLKPKDRLSYWRALQICNTAVHESIMGWVQYISNPIIQDIFSVDEIKEIFERYRELAVEFIKLDIEATKLFESKVEAKRTDQDTSFVV